MLSMNVMEDSRLKIFEAVSREQSFTRAARSLGITQSAVSQCIAELEKTLSVQLFHRARAAVTLTEAGRRFSRYACSISGLYEEISEAFPSHAGKMSRIISAEVSPDAASMLFPDLVSSFVMDGYRFSLADGHGDFAIYSAVQAGDMTLNEGECVGLCPLCAVVHPSVSAAYSGAVSLSDISPLKIAVWSPAMEFCRDVESKVFFRSPLTDSILSLVAQSESIVGIVPLHSVYKKLSDRTLVRLPILKSPGNAAIYLKASDEFSSQSIYSTIRRRLVSLLEFHWISGNVF